MGVYSVCHVTILIFPVGLAAQTIIFLRTYAISRQSRPVFITLLVIAVLCFPLQVMGNVYLRYGKDHLNYGPCYFAYPFSTLVASVKGVRLVYIKAPNQVLM